MSVPLKYHNKTRLSWPEDTRGGSRLVMAGLVLVGPPELSPSVWLQPEPLLFCQSPDSQALSQKPQKKMLALTAAHTELAAGGMPVERASKSVVASPPC